MSKSANTIFDKTPVPGPKDLDILPGRAFLHSKWERVPQADRYAHVIARAKERGGIDISPALVASIEGEIREARRMAALGSNPSPLCVRVKGNQHYRRDIFRVKMRGGFHHFIWSRRCDGIISYGDRLPHQAYTWMRIKQSMQEANAQKS